MIQRANMRRHINCTIKPVSATCNASNVWFRLMRVFIAVELFMLVLKCRD